MTPLTLEWVKKAEMDYLIAVQSSESKAPVHDGVCFHCQQCAEKYLKGLREEMGLTIVKTHDLEILLNALLPHHSELRNPADGGHRARTESR